MEKDKTTTLVIIVGLFLLLAFGGKGCPSIPGTPSPSHLVTAVTYVYEKDDGEVPQGVESALNRINRESGFKIVATMWDDDEVPVPAQYVVPLAESKKHGIPLAVATAGSTVTGVVKAPKTDADVMVLVGGALPQRMKAVAP